ncbi:hypothetical protein MKX01_032864, partial [Papaver californicum]
MWIVVGREEIEPQPNAVDISLGTFLQRLGALNVLNCIEELVGEETQLKLVAHRILQSGISARTLTIISVDFCRTFHYVDDILPF